ncbi:hypothetical protein [Nocardia sp. NRRL S-836]|uniref:hypothetical protein n=1 Tax=Nocardia sp. NRRL S-836 TaxID=1519492 RepID=UPI0006AE63FE|nr:hypothetical protein [Nocardia sp. NRRL S-836]
MAPPTACSNLVMGMLRRAMFELVEQALVDSGVTADLRDRYVDRGDWLIVLVHPTDRIPKTWLLTRLVPRLKALLDERNDGQYYPLRLRLVIHPGDVTCDDLGWFGEDLDIAKRLLMASALARTSGPLVLVVSDQIHRSVIRHGYDGVDDWVFVPLPRVEPAGEECKGWVHVPDEV